MRTITSTVAAAALSLASFAAASRAEAATTRKVGPGAPYAKPCDAIAAAQPDDVIEIAAGTYTDSCTIGVKGLTLRGVGGRPKIDLSGTDQPAQLKGIYVVDADDVRIENLELTGAHISDGNGGNAAGIRVFGNNLVVHGCYIHDSQNGILGENKTPGSTLTVENTELARNALGDGCNQGGCTHNIYVNFGKLLFQYNWSHEVANDTADKGHLFKSRSKQSILLYNRFTGETGINSYELNFPNGGLVVLVGNVVQKSAKSGNPVMVAYGEEGLSNPDLRVFAASNTFVSGRPGGTFFNLQGATSLVAHDNIFVGGGALSSTGQLPADNLSGVDPLFVSPSTYDYRLKSGSPAADRGVAPGSADAFSLVPTREYLQPVTSVPRKDDGKLDLGAFEIGTDLSPADAGVDGGGDAAPAGPSGKPGGANAPDAAAASGAPEDGAASGDSAAGCSAATGGGARSAGAALLALSAVLAVRGRRRRTS